MAINFNLSDLSSAQRRAGTMRKYNTPYTYSLLSATPYARQDAVDTADAAYKQSVLNQDTEQFNRQLEQNAAQYNTTLAQNSRQFNENQAMQQQIADEQKKQAAISTAIGGVGSLGLVAALTRDAWLPTAQKVLGVTAPKVAAAAAPATADAAGVALTGATDAAAGAGTAGAELAGAGAATEAAAGSAVGDTLGVTTGEIIGPAASALATAAIYYGLGKAAQYGGEKLHDELTDKFYPVGQLGHNLQDAVSLPGYAESGLNEGYKKVERDGRTFGSYDSNGRGVASNIIEGVLPVESGSLGRAMRDSIDAAARLNIGDAFDSAGQIMAPFTSVAEKAFGLEPGESEAINYLANPIGSSYNSIATDIKDSNWGSAGLNIATGGISGAFCFVAGTPVEMANGDIFPVEDIDLFDEVEEGGMVNGKGITLATDLYDYEGVKVTGLHAVYEDGEWKRVKNSAKGRHIVLDEPVKVYIINNENHILIINGIRFADYGEVTNSEEMTAQQRLDYLNEHCRF